MSLSPGAITELRRVVARLDRLSGAPLTLEAGAYLCRIRRVHQPTRLVDALSERGAISLADLRAAVDLAGEPQHLTPLFLGQAARDLRILAAAPPLRALLRDPPRSSRRALLRPPEWLSQRQATLERLSAAADDPLAWPSAPDHDPAALARLHSRAPWLRPFYQLLAAVHGDPAAALTLDLHLRSQGAASLARRRGLERITALAARVAGRSPRALDPGLDHALDELAAGLLALTNKRSSAQELAIWRAASAALTWPAPPPQRELARPALDHPLPALPAGAPTATKSDLRRRLAALICTYGQLAAAALHRPHDRASLAQLDRLLPQIALVAPPAAARADTSTRPSHLPPWHAQDVAELTAAWDRHREHLVGPRIDGDDPRPAALALSDALWLLRRATPSPTTSQAPTAKPSPAELDERAVRALRRALALGLRPAEIDLLLACGQRDLLLAIKPGPDAAATLRWVLRIAPHYRRLGVTLEIDEDHLPRLPTGRHHELGLLAHCLLQGQTRGATAATVARELAILDLSLGLVQRLPDRARALLQRLHEPLAGRGRALFPDFAAWLADDPLLDRFCHLSELLGGAPRLSHNLRRDFDQNAAAAAQIAHLSALADPTPAQTQRLLRLHQLATQRPDPAWTRRRLHERADEFLARAYRDHLDQLLAELVRAAYGVTLPATLTPAWRDALRFFLNFERHPRDPAFERSYQHLGLLLRHAAAAPGRPSARATPENLAWIAASAPRFDVEAWLRPRGRLIHVGDRQAHLTLEDDPLEVLRMGIPFDTCLSIHGGSNAPSTVANALDANKRVLYLRAADGAILARKLVAVADDPPRLLGYRLYIAHSGDDREQITAAFDQLCMDLSQETGLAWSVDGEPTSLHGGFWYDDGADHPPRAAAITAGADLQARCQRLGLPLPPRTPPWWSRPLGPPLHSEAQLLAALADAAGRPPCYQRASALVCAVRLLPPSAAIARAWLKAAARLLLRGDRDDHGVTHHIFYLDDHLDQLPFPEQLAALAQIAALGARFVDDEPDCRDCLDGALARRHSRLIAAYARAPAPHLILDRLHAANAPESVLRLALAIAARHPLATPSRAVARGHSGRQDERPTPLLGLSPSTGWLAQLRPAPLSPAADPAARKANAPLLRDLRRIAARHPQLTREPELFAAWHRSHGPSASAVAPPAPDTSPFELLAERTLDPQLAPVLAPLSDPRCSASAWKPGSWELAFHRRHPTAWRARLLEIAADPAQGPQAAAAARWCAYLGLRPPRVEGALATIADAVASALAGRLPGPAAVDLLTRSHRLAIDPLLALPALELWRDALAGRRPFDPAADDLTQETPLQHAPQRPAELTPRRALALLLALADDDARDDLLERLLAAPAAAQLTEAAGMILAAIDSTSRRLCAAHVLALWRLPDARPHLLRALLARASLFAELLLTELAARADHDELRQLLAAWLRERPDLRVLDELPEPLIPLACEAALAAGGDALWLDLYNQLDGPERITLALAALHRATEADLQRLREHLAQPPDPDEEPDLAAKARLFWLRHHLDRHHPPPPGAAAPA